MPSSAQAWGMPYALLGSGKPILRAKWRQTRAQPRECSQKATGSIPLISLGIMWHRAGNLLFASAQTADCWPSADTARQGTCLERSCPSPFARRAAREAVAGSEAREPGRREWLGSDVVLPAVSAKSLWALLRFSYPPTFLPARGRL